MRLVYRQLMDWFGSRSAAVHSARPGEEFYLDRGVTYSVAKNGSFRRVGKKRAAVVDTKVKHGMNKGTVVPFPKCGAWARHQWAAFGGVCLRCGAEMPEVHVRNERLAA